VFGRALSNFTVVTFNFCFCLVETTFGFEIRLWVASRLGFRVWDVPTERNYVHTGWDGPTERNHVILVLAL